MKNELKEKLVLLFEHEKTDEYLNTPAEVLSDYVVSMLGLLKSCNEKREEMFDEKLTLKQK